MTNQFHQAFQAGQGFAMEIMGFIHKEGDGTVASLDEVKKLPFPFFRLRGNLDVFLGGQVIEQGYDEGAQIDSVCVDSQGAGNQNGLLPRQFFLDALKREYTQIRAKAVIGREWQSSGILYAQFSEG